MIDLARSRLYCKDDPSKIENYSKALADTTQTWDIHHRLELTLDGEFAHTAKELMRLGMYFKRPYFELIFLTRAEHNILHTKGKHHSCTSRKKISESVKVRMREFRDSYLQYKSKGGIMSWNEFLRSVSK